jgi:hypothetical protein
MPRKPKETPNIDLTVKKSIKGLGLNKRYSLKVQPVAAKADLKEWNDGVVDAATEVEAKNRLAAFLEANDGATSLYQRGVRVSLYHYRMPLAVTGAEDPLTSKAYRKGTVESEEATEAIAPSDVVDDALVAIAAELAEAKKAGNEERVAELIAESQAIATAAS